MGLSRVRTSLAHFQDTRLWHALRAAEFDDLLRICDAAQGRENPAIARISTVILDNAGLIGVKSEVVLTENELPGSVITAIQDGRKVEAIQLLREATGIGLANAKVLVDRAWREYGPEKPPPLEFRDPSMMPTYLKAGALVVLLVALFLIYT